MSYKPYNILTDYKGSGNSVVDAIAGCIIAYRKRKIGLAAIHIKQPYYDQFKRWMEQNMGRKFQEGEFMSFDNVNIELGSFLQTREIMPETFNEYTKNQKSTLHLN